MARLILFDLDGVLVDLVDAHHTCLNKAIAEIVGPEYIITDEDFPRYNGLPTRVKLERLTEEKGLFGGHYHEIAARKQQLTIRYMYDVLKPEDYAQQRKCLHQLKNIGYTVGICSNSVRETVRAAVKTLQYDECIDFFLSNNDVKRPKPNPEIYLRGMIEVGVGPLDTTIVEDSEVGRQAAISSGARLIKVRSPQDVSFPMMEFYLI